MVPAVGLFFQLVVALRETLLTDNTSGRGGGSSGREGGGGEEREEEGRRRGGEEWRGEGRSGGRRKNRRGVKGGVYIRMHGNVSTGTPITQALQLTKKVLALMLWSGSNRGTDSKVNNNRK